MILNYGIYLIGIAIASSFGVSGFAEHESAAYQREAWRLYNGTNRSELMPTVILSNLNRAVELAPDRVSVESYILRGTCWSSAGDSEKAFRDWTLAILRDPTNPAIVEAYCGRASYWGLRKQPQKALEEINHAIAFSESPNLGFARVIRASAYRDMGMYEAASNEYYQAIELNPNLTNWVSQQEFFNIEPESE